MSKDKTHLKSYFQSGDIPTQNQYHDLIDSMLIEGHENSGSFLIEGDISASGTIYANNFQSSGGDISGVVFHDDLNITGSITASGDISASGTISATSILVNGVAVGSSTDTYWNSGSSGEIFYNAGNIGMGTTSPSEVLEVIGNISASGYIYSLTSASFSTRSTTLEASQSLSNANFPFTDDMAVTGNITASGAISASGRLTGKSLDIGDENPGVHGNSHINYSGSDNTLRGNNYFSFPSSGSTTFRSYDGSSYSNKLFISGSGNVGIGTPTPGERLTVMGNISASGELSAATVSDVLAAAVVAQIDNDEIPIAKLAEDEITVISGTNLSGGGSVTLGSDITLNVDDAFIKNDEDDATTGILTAGGLKSTTHITSSGNISASGVITGEGLLISDDATITDDLEVGGDGVLKGNVQIIAIPQVAPPALLYVDGNISSTSHITASGHISTSNSVYASRFLINESNYIDVDTAGSTLFNNSLKTNANITASGDISSSGVITADEFIGSFTGTATGLSGTPDIIVGSLTATSITSSIVTSSVIYTEGSNIFGDALNDTHLFNGSITASGNISSSGILIGGGLNINGTTTFNDGNISNVGSIGADLLYADTSIIQIGANAIQENNIYLKGPVTASGNISASGDITINNITAGGNGNFNGWVAAMGGVGNQSVISQNITVPSGYNLVLWTSNQNGAIVFNSGVVYTISAGAAVVTKNINNL